VDAAEQAQPARGGRHVVQRERGGDRVARRQIDPFEAAAYGGEPPPEAPARRGQHRLVSVDAGDARRGFRGKTAGGQRAGPDAEIDDHRAAADDRGGEDRRRLIQHLLIAWDERPDSRVVITQIDAEMRCGSHQNQSAPPNV
jgi:hypothetical protein